MLSSQTSDRDPLANALIRKARAGTPGGTEGTLVAEGDGWRVRDIVCTAGPRDRSFEERFQSASICLVMSGTFVYRGNRGASLMSPGAMLLGNAGHVFECSHPRGEGDRCLSFQFEPGLFEQIARDAGASRAALDVDRLPPLRALAPLTARAEIATLKIAKERRDTIEEVAVELAGAVVGTAGNPRPSAHTVITTDRVTRVLRYLESRTAEPHTLAELANIAGLSRYHFLRTFRRVTGVTPHQWLLRARLRDAARRVATSRAPVTEIALDAGFEDLSNFIRSFRAEFGVSPGRYRAAGL